MSNNRELSEFADYLVVDDTTKNVGIGTTLKISAGGIFVANTEVIRPDGTWGGPDTGLIGAQGAQGAQGAVGAQGAQGAVGAQGNQGRQGAVGAQGNQGRQGAVGAQGAQGYQGAAGSATITNNADNRVITGGTGTNLNGEANFTFDGSSLTIGSGNSQQIIRSWDSSDTDIDGLLSGSTFGTIHEGANNGHHVIGLRGNDATDSFAIISGSGNYQTDSTYDKVVALFKVSGDVTIDNDLTAGGTVTSNSDISLKTNITTITDALDKVSRLRGVEFDYKESGRHNIGVIAQEVEEVFPDLVIGDDPKSVAYGNLTAVLIEAVKELRAEVSSLKEEINNLKGNN